MLHVRNIWNVSLRIQSNGVQYDLMSRFLFFYDSIIKRNNECTRFCSSICKSSRSALAENRKMSLSNFNKREHCEIETPMLQKYFHCNEICKNELDILKEWCLFRDKSLFIGSDVRQIQLLIKLISTGQYISRWINDFSVLFLSFSVFLLYYY